MRIRKLAPGEYKKFSEDQRIDFINSVVRKYPEASVIDISRLMNCNKAYIYKLVRDGKVKVKLYKSQDGIYRDVWDLYIKYLDGKMITYSGKEIDVKNIQEKIMLVQPLPWNEFVLAPSKLKKYYFEQLHKPVARVADMFGVDYSSVYSIAIDKLGLRWMATIIDKDPEKDSEESNSSTNCGTGTGVKKSFGPSKLGGAEISVYSDNVEAIIKALGVVDLVAREVIIKIKVESDPDKCSRKTFVRSCVCSITNGSAEAFLRELKLYGRTRVTFYIP